MARYGYGYSRRSSRSGDKFISGLFKVGASMASAYAKEAKRQQREQARQVAAYNRFLAQQEREELRQIKQHEMAMRRAEREREKAEREMERAAKLQAKLEEQKRVEEDIASIEDNNYLWTNVHGFINQIVTLDDVNEAIAKCDYEQSNNVKDGYFKTTYPIDTQAKQTAHKEADSKYDVEAAKKEVNTVKMKNAALVFDEPEPTKDDIESVLEVEAKEMISAFLPWKQSRLRREYVNNHLESRFDEAFNEWSKKRHEYLGKKKALNDLAASKKRELDEIIKNKENYIQARTKELFEQEIKAWETERDDFYESLRQSMQNLIDGDMNYVIAAIGSLFPDEELPMEYFVDYTYEEEKGKVMVDLDLPEIEDMPDRKIILTPTGKKSIRMKGQTDLRSDYANCVFGLSMYVASAIFNISLKVKEVEISAFTQRKEANSAVATDQYVFIVNYTRDLFSSIDFSSLSSVQIMDFFQHHYNMTKSFDMKQIDLSTAYDKMEEFVPADYQAFISTLPLQPSRPDPRTIIQKQTNTVIDDQTPETQDDIDMTHLDPLFEDAARLIVSNQSGSTSLIQRKFAIGYNRAGRLMDQLGKVGIVGPAKGSIPRVVLIHDEYSLNKILASLR